MIAMWPLCAQLDEATFAAAWADELTMAIDDTRRMGVRGGLLQLLVTRIELAHTRGEPDDSWRAEAAAEIDFLSGQIYPDRLRDIFLKKAGMGIRESGDQ